MIVVPVRAERRVGMRGRRRILRHLTGVGRKAEASALKREAGVPEQMISISVYLRFYYELSSSALPAFEVSCFLRLNSLRRSRGCGCCFLRFAARAIHTMSATMARSTSRPSQW